MIRLTLIVAVGVRVGICPRIDLTRGSQQQLMGRKMIETIRNYICPILARILDFCEVRRDREALSIQCPDRSMFYALTEAIPRLLPHCKDLGIEHISISVYGGNRVDFSVEQALQFQARSKAA